MANGRITTEVLKEIERRLRALPFGRLAVLTHDGRVVAFETETKEKVDTMGRAVPA